MEEILAMVGEIGDGHNGKYAVVYANSNLQNQEKTKITFSLEKPVWQEDENETVRKGDWVILKKIRFHGLDSDGMPYRRSYWAKFADIEDINKHFIKKGV